MQHCPCGSNKTYNECCEPYLKGECYPQIPEALMRSRYTAYALENYEYIKATMKGAALKRFNNTSTGEAPSKVKWEKLEVLNAPPVLDTDEVGYVEFKAYYSVDDKTDFIHENSRFLKKQGQWFYVDGVTPKAPVVERNAPCYCGSGKKYKKCCGK